MLNLKKETVRDLTGSEAKGVKRCGLNRIESRWVADRKVGKRHQPDDSRFGNAPGGSARTRD